MAAFFTNRRVGWVKPLYTEFMNTASWVSQSSTQPTMEEKAANPTSATKNRHAGLDPASSVLDPGLRRDDGQGKCGYPSTLKSQKGMTLVEVLVAVAILSIGLLAIASMQKTAIMVNMRAFDITEAATVAQSQMERLTSLPLGHPDLSLGTAPCSGSVPQGYECFRDVRGNFPNDLTAPPAGGRLIELAISANGDTSSCGNDGTCDSCDSSDGTGSTITCYPVVGVKVAPNW